MIRVNAILPGYIETDMTQGKDSSLHQIWWASLCIALRFFFTRSSLPAQCHFPHRLAGGARAQAQFPRPPFLCAVERIAPVPSTLDKATSMLTCS